MMECIVCCEPYNKSKRKQITCSFCNYSACTSCIKTYLLDSFHKPHCMNCKKEWIHDFLTTHLGAFMKKEYRNKREVLLLEREKSFIPQLIPLAERDKKVNMINKHIKHLQDELIEWYNDIYTHRRNMERYNILKQEKKEIKSTIHSLMELRTNLYSTKIREERKTFIMKCIVHECKGFLSSRYKCGLCSIVVCKECHTEMDQEHKCNEDTVSTIQELKKSTKPCPSCQCPIYKTEGCDQMWCIQCHTAFSWKTGRVELGIVHNPHYFEYMKTRGDVPRNPLDIVCGGLVDYNKVYELIMRHAYSPDQITFIRTLYEDLAHYREDTLRIRLPNEQEQVNNSDVLLRYIMDEISEHHLKSVLYVREQKRQRGLEERQILEAYVSVCEEAFRKLVQNHYNFYEFLHETEEIKSYTKKGIYSVEDRYQHKGYLYEFFRN